MHDTLWVIHDPLITPVRLSVTQRNSDVIPSETIVYGDFQSNFILARPLLKLKQWHRDRGLDSRLEATG